MSAADDARRAEREAAERAELVALVTGAESHLAGLYSIVDDKDDAHDEDAREEAAEQANEFGYGLSLERHVILTLAGGGPSHWLEVTLDSDGDITEVVSHATALGVDPVVTRIYDNSALYRWAESETSWIGPETEGESK